MGICQFISNNDDPPTNKDVNVVTEVAPKISLNTVYKTEMPGLIMGEPAFLPGFSRFKDYWIIMEVYQILRKIKKCNKTTYCIWAKREPNLSCFQAYR